MDTRVRDSRAFIINWGRKSGKIAFFVWHPELEGEGGKQHPIPVGPDKIGEKLVELAERVDKQRGKI